MSLRGFFAGRAGLLNVSATFKAVGEPAPTGPIRMVQDVSLNQNSKLFFCVILDTVNTVYGTKMVLFGGY
jgi:hypothetical protein